MVPNEAFMDILIIRVNLNHCHLLTVRSNEFFMTWATIYVDFNYISIMVDL